MNVQRFRRKRGEVGLVGLEWGRIRREKRREGQRVVKVGHMEWREVRGWGGEWRRWVRTQKGRGNGSYGPDGRRGG
jgi:hypothetical protein